MTKKCILFLYLIWVGLHVLVGSLLLSTHNNLGQVFI